MINVSRAEIVQVRSMVYVQRRHLAERESKVNLFSDEDARLLARRAILRENTRLDALVEKLNQLDEAI